MRRWLDIRRDEWATLVWAFGALALILAAHAMLETARDALFLASIPATRLPWVYLGVAAVGLILARYHWRVRGTTAALSLLVGAAVTTAFWLVITPASTWSLYALYIWSALFASAATVQLWLLIGGRFTSSEAKRLFSYVGTGGISGAIVGSAAARAITEYVATEHLLVSAAAVMVMAAGAVVGLSRALAERPTTSSESPSPGLREALAHIRGHRYVRRVGLLVLVSMVGLTLADYLFKAIVAGNFDSSRSLAAFFASFYAGVNAIALVVQLGAVSPILRRLGLAPALAALPFLMLGPAAAIALGGGVLAGAALKGVDGSLRHSLHRTAVEVLYLPLSGRVRAAAKLLIDIAGQRGGQALGSLLILGILTAAPAAPRLIIAIVASAVFGAWMLIAISVHRENLTLFRETLRSESVDTRIAFPELDMASLEGLIARLNSLEDREVRAAMDILARSGRGHLIPDLILFHPSTEVVLEALDLLTAESRTSFMPIAERLLETSGDAEIRAAALLALDDIEPDDGRLGRHLGAGDPHLAAAAVMRLLWRDDTEALRGRLEALRRREGTELALARAARRSPSDVSESLLLELADSSDRRVCLEIIAAARERRSARLTRALIPMLAVRALRARAREALVAIGKPALESLSRRLDAPDSDPAVLHHLPRTISRFPARQAAPILTACLEHREEVVRYKALRGLGRLVAEHPGLERDDGRLDRLVRETIEAATELLSHREAAGRLPATTRRTELLRSLIEDRLRQTLEIAFRLVGLRHPRRALEEIYKGIRSDDRQIQNSARELLRDTLVGPEKPLLVLIDDLEDADKIAALGGYRDGDLADPIALLESLSRGDDRLLAEVAQRCLEDVEPPADTTATGAP